MAFHRIADADAADQQRGQADDGEELGEALDIALELRRGVAAAADVPAGLRELRCAPAPSPLWRRHRWCRWPAGAGDSASAPGCPAATGRWRASASSLTSRRGPKPMPPASLSGSLVSAARISKRGIADGEPRARLDVEPRQQRRIGDGAEGAVALRQRVGERAGRIEHDLAEQRIGAIDRLHFDQRRLAVGGARHGAHGGGARHLAVALQERALVWRGLALDQRERQIAAEDDLALRAPARRRGLPPASRRRRSPCSRARCRR